MVRGTRIWLGPELEELLSTTTLLSNTVRRAGFKPVLISTLASRDLFESQIGDNRMFELDSSLSDRHEVLIPEVTQVLRQEFRNSWSKALPKPVKLFYCQRCYRYDRPQRGRWREFMQFGVEEMPSNNPEALQALLSDCLYSVGPGPYEWKTGVDRGQAYYTQKGFEVWKNGLQIAGGGPYAEGAGWAIGIDRLLLVKSEGSICLTTPSELLESASVKCEKS